MSGSLGSSLGVTVKSAKSPLWMICLVWVVTELLSQEQLIEALPSSTRLKWMECTPGGVGVGIYHSGGGPQPAKDTERNTDPALRGLPRGSGHRCWVLRSRKWTVKMFLLVSRQPLSPHTRH